MYPFEIFSAQMYVHKCIDQKTNLVSIKAYTRKIDGFAGGERKLTNEETNMSTINPDTMSVRLTNATKVHQL
jgi:hypothetical protein